MISANPVQMNLSFSDGFLSGLGISGRTVAAVFTKSLREANESASRHSL